MKESIVGQLGIGNAGYCYIKNLIKAGKKVIAYDVSPTRRELAQKAGATIVDKASEVAKQCESIILSLPHPQAVKTVLLGKEGLLANCKKNALVIDISTIDEDTVLEIDKQAKLYNVRYLEAPMSGGDPNGAGTFGAEAGSVTFLCGGKKETYKQAQEILKILGNHTFLMGEVGSGSKIKLISNLMAGLNAAVMAEGFVLGKAAGFDFKTMFKVFKHTDAKSYTMFEEFKPHLESNDYSYGFPVELQHKDHRLASEMARKLNVPLLFNQLAMEMYQMAMSNGMERESHIAVVKQLAKNADIELYS